MNQQPIPPIAVVGVSALFPGSDNAQGFWRDIMAGKDLITDVPETHWLIDDYYDPDPAAKDKTYSKRGGFLTNVDFDPVEFGIPPSIMPATDTSQLLALMVAKQVLDDASKGQFAAMDKSKISVILGVTSGQELFIEMASRLQRPVWVKALREGGLPEDEVQKLADKMADSYVPWQESSFPGLLGNVVAGRIANRFDLGGTNCVTDAACASSLSALSMAVNELALGQSDLVISGGVDTFNDISMYMCFSKTPALSPSGDCRPFSDQADGTIIGEGLAMLAFKRLEDAERDGDRIYAVLKGLGSSSDGRAMSVYAPLSAGQAKALTRAYDAAGYGPETVELVEAHGTGTKAGDAAELGGLSMAFDGASTERQWCALGSVKSQIGHTKSTAGAAGLFKAVMALHHKVLPPTIKVDKPNGKIDFPNTAFYVNTEARPWIRGAAHPRRASVSSFGFGGSNFHVTFEEYTGAAEKAPKLRAFPTELVLLSAPTPEALAQLARARAAEAGKRGMMHFLAHASTAFDASHGARLAIVASDEADLVAKLNQAADGIAKAPTAAISAPTGIYYRAGAAVGPVGFLFPGQGSQYVGMGGDLASAFDEARAAWDAVADLRLGGSTLPKVVFPIPVFDDAARQAQQAALTATEWAQPALGVASLAALGLVRKAGVTAAAVGGHSFGEVSALAAAGVLDAASALAVARTRGELMAAAAATTSGAMTAVTTSAADLRARVAAWGIPVVVANDNGPSQVVLSGAAEAIAQAEAKLAEAGLGFKRLPVATAFHSPVVADSTAPFAAFLAEVPFGVASLPVMGNADAAAYPADDADAQRKTLAKQIASPVRFVEMVEAMYAQGVRTFLEVGPGSVLTGLVGEILKDKPHAAIATDRKGQHGVTSLWKALGQLAAAGVAIDVAGFWDGWAAPADPRAKKSSAFTLPINGTNYGKVYPPKGGSAALPKPNPPKPAVAAAPAPSAPAPAAPAPAPAPVAQAPAPVPMPAPAPTREPMTQAHDPALAAFAIYQQALADSHQAYLRAMETSLAQTQMAYMRTLEASFLAVSGQPSAALPGGAAPVVMPALPAAIAAPVMPVAVPAPVAAPVAPAPVVAAVAPVVPTPAAPAPVAAAPAPVPAPAARPAPGVDLEALMLEVVAEKTGYPVEMLNLDMALEADLGIDSIKRVEILGAVSERVPDLPEFDPGQMAALKTLGEIVVFMRGTLGAPAAAAPAAAPKAAGVDLEALMLEVVAEKTGYPTEMLSLDMALEADLGIDSIKRVEILGAVSERVPELPEFDPGQMAALKTLGEIVVFMRGAAPAAPPAAPAPVAPPAAAAAGPDLEGLMLATVAEKTGYPVEMLNMGMALEADLGIDSIKRVEILGAVQEKVPGLPDFDAGQMAALKTLGEIVDFMRGAAPAAAPAPVAAPAAGPDLEGLMLATVAEKTGYPTEMLNMGMALEADLGIDSIKRVEILGAVQEKVPGLPEFDAGQMASLKTLGEIVQFMRGAAPAPAAPVPVATQAVVPATAPAAATPFGAAIGGGLRQVLRVAAKPASGDRLALSGPALVTDDGAGLAQALVASLGARGVQARIGDTPAADTGLVVALHALRAAPGPEDAAAAHRDALALARAVAPRFSQGGGAFVTVQDTGGDFGLGGGAGGYGWAAGLPGLVKTASHEWTGAACKAIDLARAGLDVAAQAERLADEILMGGADLEVGLQGDRRLVTTLVTGAAEAVVQAPWVTSKSVILASGGARGVTAAALESLAKAAQPRIVLLGRSPLIEEPEAVRGLADGPEMKKKLLEISKAEGIALTPADLGRKVAQIVAAREVRETLRALRRAGSEALYLELDVRDAAALRAGLAPIREAWGPVTGIVHGAGVLADKLIADLTPEQFDRVFETKVDGLRALLAATSDDPLSMICMFSSVAARTGNAGQAAYAMANEVLNKVAQAEAARRGAGCLVKSLNWGPWAGGMVTPELKAHFEKQGVPLIPLEMGGRMFVDELRVATPGDVEVVLGGPSEPSGGGETISVSIDAASHPQMAGHRIQEAPVLPAVQVLDWFVAAAPGLAGGLPLAAIKDLKVLKGVTLERFDGGGDRFTVRVAETYPASPASLPLELVGADGTVHYRATAVMSEAGAAQPMPLAPIVLDPAPWGAAETYASMLFHTGGFQVIRSLSGVSKDGAAGTLAGLVEMGWPAAGHATDVAAMDGGLQVARLWGYHMADKPSLPTAIGEYHRYVAGPADGPLRVEVRGKAVNKHRTVSDIRFTALDGTVVADMRGVEMHFLPERPPAVAALGAEARA